ncbi:MAG: acyl-CoA dehydratase activase [Syntrophorhabdaceae bacterium]|nr:acyl-CoA dehydratase activase [Syntrophorhabdaceae bacterium]
MRAAGIDIGSRTVKFVIIENGTIILTRKCLTSHDPLTAVRSVIDDAEYDMLIGTGYGRHLIREHLDCTVISEIKAFAIGANAIRPSSRAILDIGGQDTKAISLNNKGEMTKFEMNDRCAAGTGRFLEIMARALGYTLEEFSEAALSAKRAENINSMCTVFAESEVISLTARGALRHEVARGIHKTIVGRSTALLRRVAPSGEIFFAGGVALNNCVRKLITDELGRAVFVPPDPQAVGAYGAALYAMFGKKS